MARLRNLASSVSRIDPMFVPILSGPVKPEMDLSIAKTRKSPLVSRRRDELIEQGMTFPGVRYQTRNMDRENIAGASVAALGAMTSGADRRPPQARGSL